MEVEELGPSSSCADAAAAADDDDDNDDDDDDGVAASDSEEGCFGFCWWRLWRQRWVRERGTTTKALCFALRRPRFSGPFVNNKKRIQLVPSSFPAFFRSGSSTGAYL